MNFKAVIKKYILTPIRRMKFRKSGHYKIFLNDQKKNRYILLSDIDHGNIGDHAIIYSIYEILKDTNIHSSNVFAFNRRDCIRSLDDIFRGVNPGDIIIIPGGGWIGTLWKDSGSLFIEILERFSKYKIVVLPQTICFTKDEYGIRQERRLYKAIENCRDITVFVRDPLSYDFLIKNMPAETDKRKYDLVPDMVLYLEKHKEIIKENDILWILRKDRESIVSETVLDDIKGIVKRRDYTVIKKDTVLPYHVKPVGREKELNRLWDLYLKSKLVITDRLHGMLFAVITSTPCLAMDNISHKVYGVYNKWLKGNDSILMIKDDTSHEEIERFIENAITNKCQYKYSKKIFKPYFQKIAVALEDNSNG